MKRTIQSLSLSLLTALLFSGSVSAAPALLQLDPTDPAVQKVTDQASRMSETNQQVASYYQKSRYRTLDAVHSSEAKAEEGGLVFEVKEIRVTPSKFLSAEEIRRAIHFKGAGPATVKELTDMVARLNALYQEKHIVTAQAVLPPQKVQDGVVYIRLIEGKFGKTVITGNQRISEKSLLSRIHGKTGELVDVDRLEDELRVYNSTNTYQVQAELVPGEEEGTSDLHLVLGEKENPLTSFIFTDNAGQKESGRYRIGAYTEYRGIGGHDASLAVSPVWTEGIWGGSVMYDTPWGHHGTRAQISYSRNLVDIIDGAFKDYDMKANSNDAAISITHPVNITPLSRVDVFLEGHRKWSDTTYSGMELSNSATRTVKAGLSARSFDENGLWFFMTSVTGYESDDRVNDKDNNGSYYSAYLMRRQNLKNDQYMLYRLYGQYTPLPRCPRRSSSRWAVWGASADTRKVSFRAIKAGSPVWSTDSPSAVTIRPGEVSSSSITASHITISASKQRRTTSRAQASVWSAARAAGMARPSSASRSRIPEISEMHRRESISTCRGMCDFEGLGTSDWWLEYCFRASPVHIRGEAATKTPNPEP